MSNIFTRGLKYFVGTMPQDRKRSSVNTEDVLNQVKRCRSSSSTSARYSGSTLFTYFSKKLLS